MSIRPEFATHSADFFALAQDITLCFRSECTENQTVDKLFYYKILFVFILIIYRLILRRVSRNHCCGGNRYYIF